MPQTKKPKAKIDPDRELIEAITSNRTDRFPELVQRYEKKLYNFGLRMCRDVQDAEDLVQETFLNVFRYLKGFRQESQFRNWLYKIAASVCLKKRRKSKFAPDYELSLEDLAQSYREDAPEQLPEWAKQPLDSVLTSELAGVMKDAIASLPEKYRLVLVLRDIEGFSTEETAQILDIAENNTKVRLHRARLYLREKLQGYYDHGR